MIVQVISTILFHSHSYKCRVAPSTSLNDDGGVLSANPFLFYLIIVRNTVSFSIFLILFLNFVDIISLSSFVILFYQIADIQIIFDHFLVLVSHAFSTICYDNSTTFCISVYQTVHKISTSFFIT